jgi:hypothetical protein
MRRYTHCPRCHQALTVIGDYTIHLECIPCCLVAEHYQTLQSSIRWDRPIRSGWILYWDWDDCSLAHFPKDHCNQRVDLP